MHNALSMPENTENRKVKRGYIGKAVSNIKTFMTFKRVQIKTEKVKQFLRDEGS